MAAVCRGLCEVTATHLCASTLYKGSPQLSDKWQELQFPQFTPMSPQSTLWWKHSSTSENTGTKHSDSSCRRVWRLVNVFLTIQPLRRCPFLAWNWKKKSTIICILWKFVVDLAEEQQCDDPKGCWFDTQTSYSLQIRVVEQNHGSEKVLRVEERVYRF